MFDVSYGDDNDDGVAYSCGEEVLLWEHLYIRKLSGDSYTYFGFQNFASFLEPNAHFKLVPI